MSKNGGAMVDRNIFYLSFIAISISMIGWASTLFNNTSDYTYSTYVISMWVWLGGAYTLIVTMMNVHNGVSVKLVCNYLIAASVGQCLIAIGMDYFPWLKNFVDSFLYGIGFMGKMPDRMYGVGCALDVAGAKFAAILVMICFLIVAGIKGYVHVTKKQFYVYIWSFIVIAVIGNMISRSTVIGVILGACMAVFYSKTHIDRQGLDFNRKTLIQNLLIILIIMIGGFVYLYRTSPVIEEHLRFAFEGFFSLVETGEWQVGSNDMLKNMVVFPDNLKTWIIGDGYFQSPHITDPYYLGNEQTEFYMGTDIGYLRFIFYFGLIGLTAFIWYFTYVTQICCKKFPVYKLMFIFIMFVNFAMWFKVSSDIFCVFAPFLCFNTKEDEEYNEYIEKNRGILPFI